MMNSRKIVPYVRVLGFSQNGKEMLSDICHINPKINMITSVKKFTDTNNSKILKEMLEKDIFATNVYTLGYAYDSWSNLDYTNKLIIV